MLFKWFEERLELRKFKDKFLAKTFPSHPSFFLGEIALFCFILLVLSGIFLGFFYEPSTRTVSLFGAMVPAAYASTVKIDLLPLGLIVRRIHHWSAMLMIAAVLAHLMRVYFTSAYRNPREINWLVGLALWVMTLFEAFTGYLLPYSKFSVTATSIAYFIAKSVPWIGNWWARLLFAGEFPSDGTVPRFFLMHVMLIPAIITGLVVLHLVILVKQKHTEPRANRNRREGDGGNKLIGIPIWPEQTFISLSLFFFMASLVVMMATYIPLNPIEAYGPPSPGTPEMRPDWYFLLVYGFLKLVPGDLFIPFPGGALTPETIGGVIFPAATIVVLALIPFLDRAREPQHYLANPLHRPLMTSFGIGGGFFLGMNVVAGYIDVLGVSARTMILYTFLIPLLVWGISFTLLRLYNRRGK